MAVDLVEARGLAVGSVTAAEKVQGSGTAAEPVQAWEMVPTAWEKAQGSEALGSADSARAKALGSVADAAQDAAQDAARAGGRGSSTGRSAEGGTPGALGAPEEASGAHTGGTSRSASW